MSQIKQQLNKITKLIKANPKFVIAGAAILFVLFLANFRLFVPTINRIMGVPPIDLLEDYQPIGSIEVYDYQDNFVGVLQGKEDRLVITLDQISDYVKKSILAAEDEQFYKHGGFSFQGFLRALIKNILAGRVVQGGSTLTQQMVKNLFIKEEERAKKSIFRKIKELSIALEVEDKYPKEKILEIYLNQVYFGNLAYGIERASQRYFSKSASDLTLNEASYLASLLTAPSYLSSNLEAAKKRQQYTLKRMVQFGYISKEQFEEVSKEELKFNRSSGNLSRYPYYFSYIAEELKKRFDREDLKTRSLKVYTGLDPVAQQSANKYLRLGIRNAAQGINQGALVSIDVHTAEVRAMVGGVGDFWKNQYNRATNIHTIGSAIKPFVYLTGFMQGTIDPDTLIDDAALMIDDENSDSEVWAPQNFDKEFHGEMTARAALIFSRNIPAIKVALMAGLNNIIKTARAAGLKSFIPEVPALALGSMAFSPLEVAASYSTLARGGTSIEPILIRKIIDNRGVVLEQNSPVPRTEGLPPRDVAQLVDIMRDVVNFGTGAAAKIPGRAIAGKTGTADGGRDIWFVGFTPDTTTAVWAGNEQNKEVESHYATGSGTTAWVWREFMKDYYSKRPMPSNSFMHTSDYVSIKIDPITGYRASSDMQNYIIKRFVPGTEPKYYAPSPYFGLNRDAYIDNTKDPDKKEDDKDSLKDEEVFRDARDIDEDKQSIVRDSSRAEEDEKLNFVERFMQYEKDKKQQEGRLKVRPKPKPKRFSIFEEFESTDKEK